MTALLITSAGCTAASGVMVRSQGWVRPSTGPLAAGPTNRPRTPFVEGSFTQTIVPSPSRSTSEGAAGDHLLTTSLLVRGGYTWRNNLELGVAFLGGSTAWSVPTATDARRELSTGWFGGGAQFRFLARFTRVIGMVFGAELNLMRGVYIHTVVDPRGSTLYPLASEHHGSEILFLPLLAVSLQLHPWRRWLFALGVSWSNSYTTPGAAHEPSCDTGSINLYGPSGGCDPSKSSPFDSFSQFTVFGSVGLRLGALTLYAQGYGNVRGDAPFGATLGLRFAPTLTDRPTAVTGAQTP